MAQSSYIYFADALVPNSGEADSTLEFAVLRIPNTVTGSWPAVYVHTYVQPVNYNLNRIRWSELADFGISRNTLKRAAPPTLQELVTADFLKDRHVVCFSQDSEPMLTLTRNCASCTSLLDLWHNSFARDGRADSVSSMEEMLELIGLPVKDSSNTGYTPLMKRLFACIAVWVFLSGRRAGNEEYANACTEFWPLPDIRDPWYSGEPKSFADIPVEDLRSYFSEHLPDHMDWSETFIYRNDWVLNRDRNFPVGLSKQDAMVDYIFNHLFSLQIRILVLAFYALYTSQITFASVISLHTDQYGTLPCSIREDFDAFVIRHLDDFLTGAQKKTHHRGPRLSGDRRQNAKP